MLTIAGEVHVQNGTHPNPLPKTLTGPDLQRFGLVQTCRGMRGFTDFCLCSTRAKLVPVSAHLSICRNFTTALSALVTGPPLDVATSSGQVRASLYACTGVARRMITTATPGSGNLRRKGAQRVDRSHFTGPGAHCTAHRNRSAPKILTSPARNSVTRIPTNPRHTRDRPPGPPEKPHLIEKSGASADAEAAPEKPHRNRRGIKNVNGIRYLCAAGVLPCPALIPRKVSPLWHASVCDSRASPPEKSHLCQKVAQQKSDFCQSRRAFQRIRPVLGPEKPHL